MADDADSKSVAGNRVWVQVPPPADFDILSSCNKLQNPYFSRLPSLFYFFKFAPDLQKSADILLTFSKGGSLATLFYVIPYQFLDITRLVVLLRKPFDYVSIRLVVQPEVYDEGLHLKWPYIEAIKTLDVKTQNKEAQTQVYTKDLQQAIVDYSVNYNLNPSEVDKLYKEIGTDYETKIIEPRVQGAIKDVVGKTEAQTLIANRTEAAQQVIEALQNKLHNEHINITNFEFKNIDYKDEFENAIEAKVIAEQDALKAKNKTVQVEEEAKQKVIAAEAEAKSMAIRAEALSQNKNLVEYEAVQKWDGKLPQYMMGNSVPFVNLNTKSGN